MRRPATTYWSTPRCSTGPERQWWPGRLGEQAAQSRCSRRIVTEQTVTGPTLGWAITIRTGRIQPAKTGACIGRRCGGTAEDKKKAVWNGPFFNCDLSQVRRESGV
jgi:hypothetical protein